MHPAQITPAATAAEAAAIAAALAQLQSAAAPAPADAPTELTPWQRTALLEGVTRAPDWQ